MHSLHNIAEVVRNGLCTGCGTCAGICPSEAIEMRVVNGLFLPEIREDECTRCLLCLRCCPGYSVDFMQLNSEIFGKQPDDSFLGNFLECYVGHSNDDQVRFGSSSGGIVTELLSYALEKGLIDGALVVRMKKDNPLEPEAFIARTREEIVSASKSKYCPVATNAALKEILSEEGKFAVVGLPCHIHGIRKAETVLEELKDKIVLLIGLFCSHTVSFMGTDFLLKKFQTGRNEVAGLDYRGKGWPGCMSIESRDGRSLNVQFVRGWNAYWNVFSPFFFTPLRCMMCPDQFSELSDISVGDAWLPEVEGDSLGESVLISRTGIVEKMLDEMKDNAVLSSKRISSSKTKESQAFSLNFKKENISSRLLLLRMFGKNVPDMDLVPRFSSLIAIIGSFLSCFSLYVSSNKRLRSLLLYVPLPLFRLYFGLFRSVSLLSTCRMHYL